jgi:very-short-patch-repair endonuclease
MRPGLVMGPHDPAKLAAAQKMRQEMTRAESRLWQGLKSNRLDGLHFRRQQVLADFILDFYCHAARLAVEVDGSIHAGHETADRERDRVLAGCGVRVLRFSNNRVLYDKTRVLAEIGAVAAERLRGREAQES